jgi:hypothetical protein
LFNARNQAQFSVIDPGDLLDQHGRKANARFEMFASSASNSRTTQLALLAGLSMNGEAEILRVPA